MFTFGFYDSLNGDRKYTSQQISSLFDGIIEDGVYANVGELFAVIPGTGLQVVVKTGRAWFNHTWNLNDTSLPLAIEIADPLRSRIDSVVIEVNSNLEVRENSIKIVKGTPSVNPSPPSLKNYEGIYQHLLANVTVDANATVITESKIENKVGRGGAPFVISPVRSVPIDDLFNQWDGEFNEWFENLKLQLSDNVVANLQRQIDEKVDIEDMATEEDILNGTPNKWIDAGNLLKSKASLLSIPFGSIIESKYENLEKKYPGMFMACDQRTLMDEALVTKITELNANTRPAPPIDVSDAFSSAGFTERIDASFGKVIGNIEWGNKVVFVIGTNLVIHDLDMNAVRVVPLPEEPAVYFVKNGYVICIPTSSMASSKYYRIFLYEPYTVETLVIESKLQFSSGKYPILLHQDGVRQFIFYFKLDDNYSLNSNLTVIYSDDNFYTNRTYTVALNRSAAAKNSFFQDLATFDEVYPEQYNGSPRFFRKPMVIYKNKLYMFMAKTNYIRVSSKSPFPNFTIYVREISFSETEGSEQIKEVNLNLEKFLPDFTPTTTRDIHPFSYMLFGNIVEILCNIEIKSSSTTTLNGIVPSVIYLNLDTFTISFKMAADPVAVFGKKFSEKREFYVKCLNNTKSNVHVDRYGNDEKMVVFGNLIEMRAVYSTDGAGTLSISRPLAPACILDFSKDTAEINGLYENSEAISYKSGNAPSGSKIITHKKNIMTTFEFAHGSISNVGIFPLVYQLHSEAPTYMLEALNNRGCVFDLDMLDAVNLFTFGNDSGKYTVLNTAPDIMSSVNFNKAFKTSFGIYYNTPSNACILFRYDNKSYIMPCKTDCYMKIAD